jgi:hypothetical protein
MHEVEEQSMEVKTSLRARNEASALCLGRVR